MTTDRTWHVDDEALRNWVDGIAGPLASVSVEQHVQRCPRCQHAVTGLLPDDLRIPFEPVLAAVEVPAPGLLERLGTRLGLSNADARVMAAAPAMRTPWVLGMITVVAFVMVSTVFADVGGLPLFLLVAPLVPVAGVAAAYGPGTDPSYDVVLAAPYTMVRLVLLRAGAVLASSIPLVVVAGLPLPGDALVAVAWLLPAAGFIAVELTASTWVDPAYAATGVAVAWAFAVALAVRNGDALAVLSPAAMACYAAILVLAVLVLLQRLLSTTPSWRLR